MNSLEKKVNLWDTGEVEKIIRSSSCGGRRKNLKSYAYRDWCWWKGFDYAPIFFEEKEPDLPYIPTEMELDQLIAGCNAKYACFLQLLKESGFRPIEALSLTPESIDIERRIVTLNTPAKRGNPRQFKMSQRLAGMLNPFLTSQGKMWGNSDVESIHRTYSNRRKKLALKLGNPKMLKITLRTFRHWKATTEYHKTKDILHVKELLGHKNIQNTMIYTHLMNFEDDEFIVRIANSIEEFTSLLESGFEYITDYDEKKVLRKRK